jgi:hypothetical protein
MLTLLGEHVTQTPVGLQELMRLPHPTPPLLVVEKLLRLEHVIAGQHQLSLQPPLLSVDNPVLLTQPVQGILGLCM